MPDIEDINTIIKRSVCNGREFVTRSDGTSWTRKLDRATNQLVSDWTPVEQPPADTEPSQSEQRQQQQRLAARYLSIVAEHQAPNEPKHWSLFTHILPANSTTDTARGQVWQVKGDAELMHHDYAADVDQLNSPDFAWHQVLRDDLSEEEFRRVDEIARAESPPRAVNRAAVREHCQGWVVRVVKQLVKEGIVKEGIVAGLEAVMDPIVR
ncbi:hypothetical protein N657DRAFT_643418 [Parathielavia appendiculata]|uniref:Uncharacterized protein n=1 Tax=Parathielavia appendiculata TaxID=2587402 RepID=A0AAN6U540_9PEZI|nr:hypothetical protein N657DRAFT_643418 [Parathielavia appendiculata]